VSNQPVFRHDCDACTFLGHFYGRDVYVCRDSDTAGAAMSRARLLVAEGDVSSAAGRPQRAR
jgi:hypothetical protein